MSESKSSAKRRRKKKNVGADITNISEESKPKLDSPDKQQGKAESTQEKVDIDDLAAQILADDVADDAEEGVKQESKAAAKRRRKKERERMLAMKGQDGSAAVGDAEANPNPANSNAGEEKAGEVEEGDGVKESARKKKKKKDKGKKAPARRINAGLRQQLEKLKEEERLAKEEEERRKKEEEEELRRIEEEIKMKEERKRLKKEKDKRRIQELKEKGIYKSKSDRMKENRAQQAIALMKEKGLIEDMQGDLETSKQRKKQQKEERRRKRMQQEEEEARAKEEAEKKAKEEEESKRLALLQGGIGMEGNDASKQDHEDGDDEELDNWEDFSSSDDEKGQPAEVDEEGEISEELISRDERIEPKEAQDVTTEEKKSQGGIVNKTNPSGEEHAESEKRGPKPAVQSEKELRSPISCILGHVDTGKTKLLDKIRKTNVQDEEAGGITQQIGASFFPLETLERKTKSLLEKFGLVYKVPGLLVIDTPGHEAFSNLRSRGTNLCDIAILVIDIMHGIENQTKESIELLRMNKTPFVVALNKIDRLNNWKPNPDENAELTLSKQEESTISDFEDRVKRVKGELAAFGLNSELYYKNKHMRKVVSLVPTSAITGEGIPDILCLLLQITQNMIEDQLGYLSEQLEATVLEVKAIDGLGMTIDVILANGMLHEGDTIVLCGMNGAIVTYIRALLTPKPLKELRVKGEYLHHKEIKAAMGVKISAPNLEEVIAGSQLFVAGRDDDIEDLKEEAMKDLKTLFSRAESMHGGKGCHVHASTLGSLEALIGFLQKEEVPVASVNIGTVFKKDVMRASIMMESKKEYATILSFDVKIEREAQSLADEIGVKIISSDIIYHLVDQFKIYEKDISEKRKSDLASEVVFPCIFKILRDSTFNTSDPIIIGCEILEGTLRVGTPICSYDRKVTLGRVTSLEINHKHIDKASKGSQVAVKIEPRSWDPHYMVGRHIFEEDVLVSKISRESLDTLKTSFKSDITKDDIMTIQKLKKIFNIM